MSESKEYLALVGTTSQLEKAFESDTDLYHYLHLKGYIKDDHYNEVINPRSVLSKKEKSSMVVSAIRQKVALNSRRYYVLLNYLRLNPRKYGDVVNLLEDTLTLRGLIVCEEIQTTSAGEEIDVTDMSKIDPVLLSSNTRKYNIKILENYGLNGRTGYWWFHFSFDYELEKSIEVRLTNFKYDYCKDWTLEIVKCIYLGIHTADGKISFDMADEFINIVELHKLMTNAENLERYIEQYIVPLVTKRIKYSKYKPQFRFYLSYLSDHVPFMRTFQNGLKFLGYDTWFLESDKPFGNILAKVKTSIERCDCFLPWIDEQYMTDGNRRSELLYAYKAKKIILPFGDRSVIEKYFTDEFSFMKFLHIYNPMNDSFFEVLQKIDETLFNFETLVL